MFFYFGLLTSVLYNTKLMLLLSFPVFTGLILLLLQIYVRFELILITLMMTVAFQTNNCKRNLVTSFLNFSSIIYLNFFLLLITIIRPK